MNLKHEEPVEQGLFQAWKEHPVTQEVFRLLEARVSIRQAEWAAGSYDASFTAEYIARNSAAKGYVNACSDILNIQYEEVIDKHE